jgi:hypothetical protein
VLTGENVVEHSPTCGSEPVMTSVQGLGENVPTRLVENMTVPESVPSAISSVTVAVHVVEPP